MWPVRVFVTRRWPWSLERTGRGLYFRLGPLGLAKV